VSTPNRTHEALGSDGTLSSWHGALVRFRRSGLIFGALILAGCTAPRIPYTAADEAAAEIPNMPDVRAFADVSALKFRRTLCTNVNINAAPGRAAAPAYLALSGGGADGAYGAGVLNGWTASGNPTRIHDRVGSEHRRLDLALCFSGPKL